MKNAAIQKLKHESVEMFERLMRCIAAYEGIEERLPLESIHEDKFVDPERPLEYYGSVDVTGGMDGLMLYTCAFCLDFRLDTGVDSGGIFEDAVSNVTCSVKFFWDGAESEVTVAYDGNRWVLDCDDLSIGDFHYVKLLDLNGIHPGEKHDLVEEDAFSIMHTFADFFIALKKEVADEVAP